MQQSMHNGMHQDMHLQQCIMRMLQCMHEGVPQCVYVSLCTHTGTWEGSSG